LKTQRILPLPLVCKIPLADITVWQTAEDDKNLKSSVSHQVPSRYKFQQNYSNLPIGSSIRRQTEEELMPFQQKRG